MGLIDRILDDFMKERQKSKNTNPQQSINNTTIVGSASGSTGRISEDDALSISSVAAATDLITSTIARLPIQLYKKGTKGEDVAIYDNRFYLLNREPNHMQTAITLKKRIVLDYLLHGNSYVYLEWSRNELIGLHHIPAKDVFIEKYVNKNLPFVVDGVIKVTGANGEIITLTPDELMIILKNSEDGLQSLGILDLNADLLNLALNQQAYSSSILENGSLPLAILTTPSKLTVQAMQRIKQSWDSAYRGHKNAGKTVVLEDGMDYKPVSLNPNELDLSESKSAVLADIARVFGIPESMINSDANKYNSNEQNNLHFLQYTLDPIITAIEGVLNRCLLLEEEKKKGYVFKFDRDSILATTESEKIQSTITAMKGGLISVNEARARHNFKQIGDDYMMWSLGNIFYNLKDGRMTIPNMGAIIDPNDPESLAKALGKLDTSQPQGADNEKKQKEKDDLDEDEKEDLDTDSENSNSNNDIEDKDS